MEAARGFFRFEVSRGKSIVGHRSESTLAGQADGREIETVRSRVQAAGNILCGLGAWSLRTRLGKGSNGNFLFPYKSRELGSERRM